MRRVESIATWILHMNNPNDADNEFMSDLNARLNIEKNRENTCPLVVLDCMLPRQVLRVRLSDPVIVRLVKKRWLDETPTFGVRGTDSHDVPLLNGVEVEIMSKPNFIEDGNKALLMLKAKRRFQVLSEDENNEGWRDASIKYLDSENQEKEEERQDHTCIDRAKLMASQLTDLIQIWIALARLNEKREGQIDLLLGDIGEEPSSNQPSEKAFYVGALINPLPEMEVAKHIRPALIMAETAEKRIQIVHRGLVESIKHMDGTEPLW